MIAGGPFHCAKGQVLDALTKCMKTSMGTPSSADSINEAQKLFRDKLIDNPKNLNSSRVYILSGTKDEIIVQKVSDVLVETYKSWGLHPEAIKYENKLPAGHAFPTDNFGNPCATPAERPYISKCGRDVAGEILSHILGYLRPRKPAKNSRFFTFDQMYPLGQDSVDIEKLSMHKTGYAYIPEGCEYPEAAGCRIHVAFHGCNQSLDDIQTTFITKAGYNAWAEANKIVVIYPQVVKSLILNPYACWDWWGYTGADYHTKKGLQMKQVMRIVEALQGGALQLRQTSL